MTDTKESIDELKCLARMHIEADLEGDPDYDQELGDYPEGHGE